MGGVVTVKTLQAMVHLMLNLNSERGAMVGCGSRIALRRSAPHVDSHSQSVQGMEYSRCLVWDIFSLEECLLTID
jgi:hypothetical protein